MTDDKAGYVAEGIGVRKATTLATETGSAHARVRPRILRGGVVRRKLDELKVEMVDPRSLNPSIFNPRKISAKKMALLRKSLATFGFVDPAMVRRKGDTIIGGHQRVAAAILEGIKLIPIVRLNLSAEKAKLLNLALNAEFGTVDVPKLSFLLKELKLAGAEMDLTGYDPQEISNLTAETNEVLEQLDLRPPPSIVWILCGIPFERFGKAQEPLAALQSLADVTVQSNRD